MNSKVTISIAGLALIGFLSIIGTIKTSSQTVQEKLARLQHAEDRGSLRWHAEVAKVKGQRQTVITSPPVEYASDLKTLEEALPHFGIVVAEPITSISRAVNPDDLRMWYKFAILENLSQRPLPTCSTCGYPTDFPKELLPLESNEILIETYGGTVEIDGVKVSVVDGEFPQFKKNQKYVLFITTDPSHTVGLLRMGARSAYRVDSEGHIECVGEQPHPFSADIETRFNKSLDQLRVRIHSLSTTQ